MTHERLIEVATALMTHVADFEGDMTAEVFDGLGISGSEVMDLIYAKRKRDRNDTYRENVRDILAEYENGKAALEQRMIELKDTKTDELIEACYDVIAKAGLSGHVATREVNPPNDHGILYVNYGKMIGGLVDIKLQLCEKDGTLSGRYVPISCYKSIDFCANSSEQLMDKLTELFIPYEPPV